MKKVILLLILIVAAMIGVNAQDSAKQDSIVQDSILMAKSLEAFDLYQVQHKVYAPVDSLLILRYKNSKGTFIHRQKVKLERPYQYEEDGEIIIEDMYKQKDEEKQFPTSKPDFDNWIDLQRKMYLKK